MAFLDRGDAARVPAWAIAAVLSVILHGLVLVSWRVLPLPPSADGPDKGTRQGRLQARLALPPAEAPPGAAARAVPPPAAPAPPARAAPPPQAPRPPAPPPPPPPPPSPAVPPRLSAPAPTERPPPVAAAPAVPPVPAPPRAAEPGDFSAMVAANQRRRAPAEAAPAAAREASAESESRARSERDVAVNLGTLKAPAPGENTRRGGGVFQLRRVGPDDAEFLFFGWNKDMGRNNTQLVEVRRGTHPDIRLAVVRRMIGIVREHEKGDFLWESRRLRRHVNLSAREADSAELEAFLLAEFF
ncbi:MAG: hypothetical protein JNM90_21975 [Burkholderiales bacterium]|nr:hypothetical protein [Burkholderiales bacterium]